jgi:DNA adenine methylase
MARPFIKWAGGKRQLMDHIISNLPTTFGKGEFRKYAEPFVGGGAVMFKLFELKRIDEAIIIDYNSDLILTYEVIKNDIEMAIEKLTSLQNDYDAFNYEQRKEQFFKIRTKFNSNIHDDKSYFTREEKAIHASRFIFLNKVGFNGLYRVNSNGEFNVPPSDLKKKVIFEDSNLRAASQVLEKVEIYQGDFSECEDKIDNNTFVYFDPPYKPITKTSFTAYANSNFNDVQQKRLADFCVVLTKNGVKIMTSNSNPKQNDDSCTFFDDIYDGKDGFSITPVQAIRSINSKGSGRGKVSELIITNY